MRALIFGSLFIFVAGMLSGCGSSKDNKTGPASSTTSGESHAGS